MDEYVLRDKKLVEDLVADRLKKYPQFQNYQITYHIEVVSRLLPKLEVYIVDIDNKKEKRLHFSSMDIFSFIYSKIVPHETNTNN